MAIKQHKRKSNGSDVGVSSKKHKTATSNSNKDLSSSAQKRQVRKERQSHRRHADIVAEAKILWNKLRVKTNTPDDTTALMEQVMSLIRGKVAEIALQHDASRVIQAAIQFGSTDQRRELLTELCASQDGSLAELAKIQYAHFCCLKLIKYCNRDDECIKMIIKSFQGEIPKLAVHGVASRVVESLFLNLPPKTTAQLKQEFYGPHFSLFVRDIKGVPTLQSNLKVATTGTQKQAALDFVKGIINKGMTKSFYGYTFFQQIFAEYMDVADPSDIRSMASTVADHSIHLLSTRAGTRVVAACASYGTPKDRKRICKSLKGYTTSSLLHRDAYLALLRLIQVTDDTVSIQKSILNEILTAPQSKKEGDGGNENTNQGNVLLDLALSETGSKLFLMLVVQDQSARLKYFDPYERTILEPVAMIKENGKDTPTSKKDPEARRKELLTYLEEALLNLCTENVEELLFSVPGSRILKEVYAHSKSEKLAKSVAKACHKAMLLYKENPQNEEKLASLFDDVVAHRAVKNLVLHDAENDVDVFTMALISLPENAFLDLMSTNRGAFVLSAMFKVSAARAALGKLRDPKVKKKLKSIYDRAEAKAGYEALMEALEEK